jgi:hypothetical protein
MIALRSEKTREEVSEGFACACRTSVCRNSCLRAREGRIDIIFGNVDMIVSCSCRRYMTWGVARRYGDLRRRL